MIAHGYLIVIIAVLYYSLLLFDFRAWNNSNASYFITFVEVLCFHTRNSFALLHSDIIHIEADDFALFRNKHDFVIVMNNPTDTTSPVLFVIFEVLRAFTTAFLQCVSFRIIAFTKTSSEIVNTCASLSSALRTPAPTTTSPALKSIAAHAVSRPFHEANIILAEANSDTQFSDQARCLGCHSLC